jgi:hypothetical protein
MIVLGILALWSAFILITGLRANYPERPNTPLGSGQVARPAQTLRTEPAESD